MKRIWLPIHETTTFLDVKLFICKSIDVYNCSHFVQTDAFYAIFGFFMFAAMSLTAWDKSLRPPLEKGTF